MQDSFDGFSGSAPTGHLPYRDTRGIATRRCSEPSSA